MFALVAIETEDFGDGTEIAYREYTDAAKLATYTTWADNMGRSYTITTECECGNAATQVREIGHALKVAACDDCAANWSATVERIRKERNQKSANAASRVIAGHVALNNKH